MATGRATAHLVQWRTLIGESPLTSPFPQVPISNDPLHVKILTRMLAHATTKPKGVAVSDPKAKNLLTYGDVYTQAHSINGWLRTNGFRKNDVAALILPNCIEIPSIFLGVLAAGGSFTGINSSYTESEMERQLLDCGCCIIFTDSILLGKVRAAATNNPAIETIVCTTSMNSCNGIVSYAEVLSFPPLYEVDKAEPDDVAMIPYSSGTTGLPKGVMLTHRNMGTMYQTMHDHFSDELMGSICGKFDWLEETMILQLPFFHAFGFGIMAFSLLSGATGIVLPKFEPSVFLKAPRLLFLVPPILLFLIKHPLVREFNKSSVKIVFTGAAPAGSGVCKQFLAANPDVKYLVQGYGMTECSMVSHLPLLEREGAYTCIGVVNSTFEQKTVHLENGNSLGPKEVGEICVRSPCVMKGYLNRPEETTQIIDGEGWLHTDRLKELIKVKGMQVAPAELEDLLHSHPLVKDVAVIGIPDEKMGELVRAYVVPVKENKLNENSVVHFVAGKVSEFKHLTGGVRFVNEIPKNPSGKILRRILREMAKKETESDTIV